MVDVLMIGAGEYTTGFVQHAGGAASDKPAGVIAVTLLDLQRRGELGSLSLVDAAVDRLPLVRNLLMDKIGSQYKDMRVSDIRIFPEVSSEAAATSASKFDPDAFRRAVDAMPAGSFCTVFTPDNTHFDICKYAIEHGMHVLVAKPAVKQLAQLKALATLAEQKNVLLAVEFHKRFDPVYADAHNRIRSLGDFSYFSSTMTQCRSQLLTFASWAGKASDISYYLNSHHVDVHCWSCCAFARPIRVTAMATTGIGEGMLKREPIEDTITILCQWRNVESGSLGLATYMASWAAPKADCHTQQYFHYQGHEGEVRADQAHRGYAMSGAFTGFATLNPLYMTYTPDEQGFFCGQQGYGYQSIARFADACKRLNAKQVTLDELKSSSLALASTAAVQCGTAILEAGRLSLDNNGKSILIDYDETTGLPSKLTVQ